MGQNQSTPGDKSEDDSKKKKIFETPVPMRRKVKRTLGPDAAHKLPTITPLTANYLRFLKLERVKDYLLMEEEFVIRRKAYNSKDTTDEDDLKKIEQFRGTPMGVGKLEDMVDDRHAIVRSPHGGHYYVYVYSFVNKDLLEPGCTVLLHFKKHHVVGVLSGNVSPRLAKMKLQKVPQESYAEIGGLHKQIEEIKEAVELPLTHPEYYEDMGITPPKGVILYGPPGTGKTLLVKAVANKTSATFMRIVGSELIQKYSGEGAQLVRDLFKLAEVHSPTIIFIDEIDAVGTKRYSTSCGGQREVQRTMLELLNQLDGFDSRADVKVIIATNRIQSLDPALIRPGRIDRKIEFPLPDEATKRHIFGIHSSKMQLADDFDLKDILSDANDDISGADIKAICTEAGLRALRERRMKVTYEDFKDSKKIVLYRKKDGTPEDLYL